MARRYDHLWKEVQDINESVVFLVQLRSAIRGIGYLVVTWTTVVLLGGFVSMLHKQDFWFLTLITLIQILWINGSFHSRFASLHLFHQYSETFNLSSHKRQLADKAPGDHPKLAVVVAGARRVVALVLNCLLTLCIFCIVLLYGYGLFITTSLSVYGLVKNDYHGDTDEGRTNMYLAHNVLYVLCVTQGALLLYIIVLESSAEGSVKQVSQAYGFQDGGRAVSDYFYDIKSGCEKNPSYARERNLVTYAIELMESNSPSRCLSGTLIIDRLLTRKYSGQIKPPTFIAQVEEKQREQQQQSDLGDKTAAQLIEKKGMNKERRNNMEKRRKKKEEMGKKKHQKQEEATIALQRTLIKRLIIESASSTHILQKLLHALDSRSSYEKKMKRKMRKAAVRILEHVADGICLEEFPRGIRCISSLICRLQQYESSSPPPSESESESDSDIGTQYSSSSKKLLKGYKDLVLTGLRIIRSLAGSEDNSIMLINTKYLVSKIMAPVSYDLVHRSHHSAWSTSVVEASMSVMLRLIVTAKDTQGDTWTNLCEQISNNEAIATMEKIVTCEKCKGGELQMTAMQILVQLRRGSFTKMLIELFINGDGSITKTAGKELVWLFLGSKSVAALLPKEENDEFIGGLCEIVSQVENNDARRRCAAEILEHMCIHYSENEEYQKKENGEYLTALKDAIAGAMPKVLREILIGGGLTQEEEKYALAKKKKRKNEEKPEFLKPGTDVESQVPANGKSNKTSTKDKKNSDSTSPSPWQNKHHKLHVALLSLYVTACEKLHLDIDAIAPGGDKGKGVAFRFARRMVRSNRHHVTVDSLSVIKLSTRLVIATMMKPQEPGRPVVKPAHLETLMEQLTSTSKNMLDLEGCMVIAARTTTVPATADTLDSLVKRAQELHSKIKKQDESEIVSDS